jgi:translation initiation factor 2B subunit (eIF-2B alpha/beta/delta family)
MKNIMGLHDASLGARSNETSGKAIMARQREGDVSTFNFIDNRNRAVEHAGRIIVDLIPKIYTVPRILRCIKEDGTDYSVPVNQPVMPEGPPQQPGQPPMPSQTPAYVPAPEKIEGVTKIFDLTTGKYDVSVTTGPSFTSRRDEAATQMMEFIRVFPQAAPLIGDLLAKNLDWPGSDEVADRLKAMLPPQAAGQVPPIVNQLRQQLQQQDKMAREAVGTLQQQLQQTTQQLNDKAVETQMKMRDQEIAARKVAIDEQKAETERIKVIGELQQAEKDRIAGIMKSANDNLANQTAGNIQSTAEQPPAM